MPIGMRSTGFQGSRFRPHSGCQRKTLIPIATQAATESKIYAAAEARVCGWTFLFWCEEGVDASRTDRAQRSTHLSSLSLDLTRSHNSLNSLCPRLSTSLRRYYPRVNYDQHVNHGVYAATFTNYPWNYQPPALSSNSEHCRSSNSTAQHRHSPGS